MKALKSKLAEKVLSDPKGKELIRHYLVDKGTQSPQRGAASGPYIAVTVGNATVRVKPVTVAKAA